jgi:hypothetical protein
VTTHRPLRRLGAVLAALWVTVQSTLAPVQACRMHDAPAAIVHTHDAVAGDHVAPTAHASHAAAPDAMVAHCAGDVATTAPAPAPASPHEAPAPPCTCSGRCCPGALVAVPAITPARVAATIAVAPATQPPRVRGIVAPYVAARHRQPPATAPPVLGTA